MILKRLEERERGIKRVAVYRDKTLIVSKETQWLSKSENGIILFQTGHHNRLTPVSQRECHAVSNEAKIKREVVPQLKTLVASRSKQHCLYHARKNYR